MQELLHQTTVLPQLGQYCRWSARAARPILLHSFRCPQQPASEIIKIERIFTWCSGLVLQPQLRPHLCACVSGYEGETVFVTVVL